MQVRLSAEFESDDYQKYQAVVRNIDTGEQVMSGPLTAGAVGRAKRVSLTLSPKTLKAGDYILSLAGLTPDGEAVDIRSYYFRITGQ